MPHWKGDHGGVCCLVEARDFEKLEEGFTITPCNGIPRKPRNVSSKAREDELLRAREVAGLPAFGCRTGTRAVKEERVDGPRRLADTGLALGPEGQPLRRVARATLSHRHEGRRDGQRQGVAM